MWPVAAQTSFCLLARCPHWFEAGQRPLKRCRGALDVLGRVRRRDEEQATARRADSLVLKLMEEQTESNRICGFGERRSVVYFNFSSESELKHPIDCSHLQILGCSRDDFTQRSSEFMGSGGYRGVWIAVA
jgi:hypothetical protein